MPEAPESKESKMIPNKEVAFMSLQIGFSVAFVTVFFILVGRWLDQHYDKSPLFIIIGALVGLTVALYLVWQIVKSLQEKK